MGIPQLNPQRPNPFILALPNVAHLRELWRSIVSMVCEWPQATKRSLPMLPTASMLAYP